MKVVILDGTCENDPTGERVFSSLKSETYSHNWEVEHVLQI
jgi:hypothetical protein